MYGHSGLRGGLEVKVIGDYYKQSRLMLPAQCESTHHARFCVVSLTRWLYLIAKIDPSIHCRLSLLLRQYDDVSHDFWNLFVFSHLLPPCLLCQALCLANTNLPLR